MSQTKRVLILFAHPSPHRSEVNQPLFEACQSFEHVTAVDLYQEYPTYNINIEREQQRLRDHDVIVFHHPFYWYSSPALLKEWQDLVLEHGFAYGHGGKALHGKWLLTVITTGGGVDAYRREGYNYFTIPELLQPFEQTAWLCGMVYLPPFVVHGVNQHTDEEIQQCRQDYGTVVEALRDGHLEPEKWAHMTYINEAVSEGGSHA